MAKLNKDISKNYNTYETLVKGRKHTKEKTITLNSTKPNRRDIRYAESDIEHTTLPTDILLMIESKIKNSKDFKFKLRCKELANEPFFRFDSAGATHRNTNPDTVLKEQMVTTPHFNCFDDKGRNIAYKTAKLEDLNEARALEDINLCFAHFCFEANMRYPIDEVTEIVTTPTGQLNLGTDDEDILSSINFGI